MPVSDSLQVRECAKELSSSGGSIYYIAPIIPNSVYCRNPQKGGVEADGLCDSEGVHTLGGIDM